MVIVGFELYKLLDILSLLTNLSRASLIANVNLFCVSTRSVLPGRNNSSTFRSLKNIADSFSRCELSSKCTLESLRGGAVRVVISISFSATRRSEGKKAYEYSPILKAVNRYESLGILCHRDGLYFSGSSKYRGLRSDKITYRRRKVQNYL
ncbi:hypothetical protein L218DRAFT_961644 [Marasmius fiardii PR-910]|nr:hypothetical protein L218DRAFT_961644 [Marasmius fiardii PR-910]